MELCDRSLEDLIKKSYKFKEHEIFEIVEEIEYSLQYMHSKEVIHRDLKPGNILYKEGWLGFYWKISDFGASVKNKSKYKTTLRDTMTYEYASIEQL